MKHWIQTVYSVNNYVSIRGQVYLVKGHLAKTKSQVRDIRTIGPLFYFLFVLILYLFFNMS